jgi:hypothetical protein
VLEKFKNIPIEVKAAVAFILTVVLALTIAFPIPMLLLLTVIGLAVSLNVIFNYMET